MGWSDEQVEALKRHVADGLTAGQIVRALGGGYSRNAVIGKVARLGLCLGGASMSKSGQMRRAEARREQQRNYGRNRGTAKAVRPATPKLAAVLEPERFVRADGNVVTLLNVRQTGECRWPLWGFEGKPSEYGLCGHNTFGSTAYCEHHAHKASGSGTWSERSAANAALALVTTERAGSWR